MRLLKMELYKITARPVMNIAFFVMLGFFLLVLWQEADGTRTELDGEVYHGLEAIRADRQIAKGYEGPFTMEKAEDIVGRFGFSGYMEEGFQTREGNFSSQFVTDAMTDFLQTGQRPVGYFTGDDWENYGKRYVEGNFWFGYTKGWEKMQDVWYIALVSLHVWLVLMAAPVFSEEYSRETTVILLSSCHGKSTGIRRKIEAAMGIGVLAYLCLCALMLGLIGILYGWDGLGASAGMMVHSFLFAGHGTWSVAFFLSLQFLLGLASVLLDIAITLFLSSKCSRPATAVTAGMALYFLPYVGNQVVFRMLLDFGVAELPWGWAVMDALRIFCFSMPLYLPHKELAGIPSRWLWYIPAVAALVLLASIWRGCRNYWGYE